MSESLMGSFEKFLLKGHPDICLTCWGQGKLHGTLPITRLNHEIDCPACKGTGKDTEHKSEGYSGEAREAEEMEKGRQDDIQENTDTMEEKLEQL